MVEFDDASNLRPCFIQIGSFDDISRTCDSWNDLSDGVILSELIQDMYVCYCKILSPHHFAVAFGGMEL